MRAKAFPHLLFETIHQAVGEPEIKKWPDPYPNVCYKIDVWDYFVLFSEDEHLVVHIGLTEENNKRLGIVSRLNIWGYAMQNSDAHSMVEEPLLEIRGGPREVGVWTIGQGNLLREEIIVKAGGYFHYGGENLESPSVRIIGEVLNLACQLQNEVDIKQLSYWEAFRHPERKYKRP
ncbi:hypothetical protein HY450_02150 [Candidatus Pacearchaeota archaeon]|nr:hypothetical protein [Candidatus Pacearchaeota archaeon]